MSCGNKICGDVDRILWEGFRGRKDLCSQCDFLDDIKQSDWKLLKGNHSLEILNQCLIYVISNSIKYEIRDEEAMTIRWLLSHGADPNVKDGGTPILFSLCRARTNTYALMFMIEYGVDINIIHDGKNALSYSMNNPVSAMLLFTNGARPIRNSSPIPPGIIQDTLLPFLGDWKQCQCGNFYGDVLCCKKRKL